MNKNEPDISDLRNEMMENEALRRANDIVKKHRKEITRLNKLVSDSIIKNNFSSYEYGIKKLRDIYKQPYNDKLIENNWLTTREAINSIILESSNNEKTKEQEQIH